MRLNIRRSRYTHKVNPISLPSLNKPKSREKNRSRGTSAAKIVTKTLTTNKRRNNRLCSQGTVQAQHRTRPPCPLRVEELRIGRSLGRGTMGRVALAGTGTVDMAVKIIPKELHKYGQIEANILKTIKHPYIVDYYGKLEDSGLTYLILEHIPGRDLFYIKRRHHFRLQEVVFICAELFLALEYLHSEGVIYRDLKPENIMISPEGHVKLIDFGLSKQTTTGRTFTVCGSPEYMAPELLTRRGYDFSVDWWGFAVLIYELMCG